MFISFYVKFCIDTKRKAFVENGARREDPAHYYLKTTCQKNLDSSIYIHVNFICTHPILFEMKISRSIYSGLAAGLAGASLMVYSGTEGTSGYSTGLRTMSDMRDFLGRRSACFLVAFF